MNTNMNGMIVYCGAVEGFAEDQKLYNAGLAKLGMTAQWIVEDALRMCDVRSLRERTGWVIVTSGTHPKAFEVGEAGSLLLQNFVTDVIAEELPLLGIARGACAIAASFGGDVEDHSERGENGVVDVNRLRPADDDPLFDDAPEIFRAAAYRNDDVMALPVQCVPMANSRLSQFHIFKVAGKNVYGLQFDPLLSVLDEELGDKERFRMRIIVERWLATR